MIKHKKKLNLLLFFCAILIVSCNTNKKIVKADLSFRSITLTSAYGAEQDFYNKYINEADSIVSNYDSEQLDNKIGKYQNYLLSKHILKLHKLNLLKLPQIYLHFGSDSIMEVHISEQEYGKIKQFQQVDLYKEKKKVILELEIEEKNDGIYYSDNIISAKKVDGKSRSNI